MSDAVSFIRDYIAHVEINGYCKITNGYIKKITKYKDYEITYEKVDEYFNWLIKEIDDTSAIEYFQKPSDYLPDEAVILEIHKNVLGLLELRKYLNESINNDFHTGNFNKNNPMVLKMRYIKNYSNWQYYINMMNDFFKQLKKRSPDSALVEIVQPADTKLQDDEILVKIYGDIWSKEPLFHEYPPDK